MTCKHMINGLALAGFIFNFPNIQKNKDQNATVSLVASFIPSSGSGNFFNYLYEYRGAELIVGTVSECTMGCFNVELSEESIVVMKEGIPEGDCQVSSVRKEEGLLENSSREQHDQENYKERDRYADHGCQRGQESPEDAIDPEEKQQTKVQQCH